MSRSRLLLTQSLLSAWLWMYKAGDPEQAQKDFAKTLRREPTPRTKPIQDGIQFENLVTAWCEGEEPEKGHKWAEGIRQVGQIVQGGAFQVAAYRDMVIDGIPFLLYGRLDVLKAGEIYDIKFSRSYRPGKYLDSPQHPMYFACCPEVERFTYLVSNGRDLYREIYTRNETPEIETIVKPFVQYLEFSELDELYAEKWRARD